MLIRTLVISIAAAVTLSACKEQPPADKPATSALTTTTARASYSFGADFASRLQSQGIELDAAAFNRGVNDVFGHKPLALNEEERRQAKQQFNTELREKLAKKQEQAAKANLQAGADFLAKNGKKEGVTTTDSGLQYKVIKSGDGPQPTLDDTVTTHYRGTLIDGRVFDSSYDRGEPASFPVKGVIKGWTEALQLMHVGDKWELYVPSELAYGNSKRSELIQPNSTLIFEIELLGIKGK